MVGGLRDTADKWLSGPRKVWDPYTEAAVLDARLVCFAMRHENLPEGMACCSYVLWGGKNNLLMSINIKVFFCWFIHK